MQLQARPPLAGMPVAGCPGQREKRLEARRADATAGAVPEANGGGEQRPRRIVPSSGPRTQCRVDSHSPRLQGVRFTVQPRPQDPVCAPANRLTATSSVQDAEPPHSVPLDAHGPG